MKVYFWTSSKCYPSQPASSASSAQPTPTLCPPRRERSWSGDKTTRFGWVEMGKIGNQYAEGE